MSDMTRPPSPAQQRALKILAKSIYRELKGSGYSRTDIVSFTTELLDLVTAEIKNDGEGDDASA
jgi:hypothetical protein